MLRLDRDMDAAAWEGFGKVVSTDARSVVLQVPNEQVSAVVTRALASFPVQDLTVENAPLEEVMSELFSRSRAAAEESAT
jgi:ABC-2 type transport system ATP-binding protein